jgi:hypothetical protein
MEELLISSKIYFPISVLEAGAEFQKSICPDYYLHFPKKLLPCINDIISFPLLSQ